MVIIVKQEEINEEYGRGKLPTSGGSEEREERFPGCMMTDISNGRLSHLSVCLIDRLVICDKKRKDISLFYDTVKQKRWMITYGNRKSDKKKKKKKENANLAFTV